MSESKVAYLGPEASYTHQAALKLSKASGDAYRLEPQVNIEDVFAAVQEGRSSHGVVPFENSSNGSVVFTLDLFANLSGKYPDILVVDEVYLPVRHCLVGRRTADHNDLSHIQKLYSHPQAWGQCKSFLSSKLKGVERQDVSSTSKGAVIVAGEPASANTAAISSKLAAELNDLDILVEGIEDVKGNATRFFVLQRRDSAHLADQNDSAGQEHTHKTMVSLTVDHNSPGALADALAVFRKHDLSLTSINTRPSGQQRWMYIFFVEFWGCKGSEVHHGPVNQALDELQTTAHSYRWLGSWKSASQDDL